MIPGGSAIVDAYLSGSAEPFGARLRLVNKLTVRVVLGSMRAEFHVPSVVSHTSGPISNRFPRRSRIYAPSRHAFKRGCRNWQMVLNSRSD